MPSFLSLTLSLIPLPPPPFPLHLSICILFFAPPPLFPTAVVGPQRKFIGGGGMPVEVKRVSGSLSDSPIILYSSSSGRAFITLNYMLQLLPLPPGPCRTVLGLSSYHLTQEERNAGTFDI